VALSEFSLIERYFSGKQQLNSVTRLGIGDDCALLDIPEDFELAVTTDTMVENVHFFPGANPEWLGHKLLAVNFSDLASMGAKPVAVTLALTLPRIDEVWLDAFAKGLLNLAEKFSVDLVGGDTTSGPLALTVQAMGLVPKGEALQRSAAQPGDLVFVTGELGNAGLGLIIEKGLHSADAKLPLQCLHQPAPRVSAGLSIRGFTNACIDVSDGLAADLRHMLNASQVGARIIWNDMVLSSPVLEYIEATGDWKMPLIAGDDYELCFTVSPEKVSLLECVIREMECSCRQIGIIETQPGLRLQKDGKIFDFSNKGFEHFTD
jgi:thiamine-monophosphate kinase